MWPSGSRRPAVRRAIVFDMDDTLYPIRRFAMSGFKAVSRHLARGRRGLDSHKVLRTLARASRTEAGREMQVCIREYGLPPAILPKLIHVFLAHRPDLRLPADSARTLHALRLNGWRLAVLTNGTPAVQARKVGVLGLAPLVDAVVYATQFGRGIGKPDPDSFYAVADRLEMSTEHIVFVGDDEECDVEGAARVGMRTVRFMGWTGQSATPTAAEAVIHSMAELPAVARALIESPRGNHRVGEESAHRHVA